MGKGSVSSAMGAGVAFPQVAEGGSEGGKSFETVEDRGRVTDRRRVDAVAGASSPVKGLLEFSMEMS